MASSSSPSAPAFSSQPWKYHVFLSFRGEDTRKTFVDHLYFVLEQRGFYTYKDDEKLRRGELIGPSLLKAIEESQIVVVIFSENYANSSWCLDELACIMKCKETKGQIVMPIFYNACYNVDPSELRKQKQKYGSAVAKFELENKNKVKSLSQAIVDDPWGWLFAPREQKQKYDEARAKHELENKTKVESWRKALVDADNHSGHIYSLKCSTSNSGLLAISVPEILYVYLPANKHAYIYYLKMMLSVVYGIDRNQEKKRGLELNGDDNGGDKDVKELQEDGSVVWLILSHINVGRELEQEDEVMESDFAAFVEIFSGGKLLHVVEVSSDDLAPISNPFLPRFYFNCINFLP
ncbi:hypothetical protein L1887_15319 [Cichorium endivia]|nr:hypothetical protein L1887_15319 [Cichorium endivia]